MIPKAEGKQDRPEDKSVASVGKLTEQVDAERQWTAKREQILKSFREKRTDLSGEILTDKELYKLGKSTLRETFVDNLKESSGVFEGTFNPRNNANFEVSIRLKHLVPPKYKYIEVKTADGQLLKGTRRGETSENGDLRDMEDKEIGSFYTAEGTYIPIWKADNFKAMVSPPPSDLPLQAPAPAPRHAASPPTAAEARPAATVERRETAGPLPETSEGETWFVGDSLSVGYLGYGGLFKMKNIPPDEIKRTKMGITKISSAVGGRLTGPMLTDMRERLSEQRSRVKKVVIFGGVNDLASGRTPEQIITNLNVMCGLARQAGLKVVICTIPSWDTEKYATKSRPDFCGPRHLTGEKLAQRTDAVNAWIRQQAAAGAVDGLVDLNASMGRFDTKEAGYQRSDDIHFRSYRKMAQLVEKEANITV